MNHREKIQSCIFAAKRMRLDSLKMALIAGNSHLEGGLSLIEIMAVLYLGIMNVDATKPTDEKRDRLIFSKGHGALALYTALNQAGFIKDEELLTYKSNDTFLYGHPSMNMAKGIEFSSGSLGQGLSLGVGCSLALRLKNNFDSRVFVILGDGECNEGSVWEAAASASHYNLSNIRVIVDKNGLQYDGNTSDILSMESLTDKWKSFGWDVIETEGHNIEKLYEALCYNPNKPMVLIANTIKGKGVSFMENNQTWHHARLTEELYEKAIKEVKKL